MSVKADVVATGAPWWPEGDMTPHTSGHISLTPPEHNQVELHHVDPHENICGATVQLLEEEQQNEAKRARGRGGRGRVTCWRKGKEKRSNTRRVQSQRSEICCNRQKTSQAEDRAPWGCVWRRKISRGWFGSKLHRWRKKQKSEMEAETNVTEGAMKKKGKNRFIETFQRLKLSMEKKTGGWTVSHSLILLPC